MDIINYGLHNMANTKKFSLNGMCTFARLIDVYDGDTITCIFPLYNNFYQFNCRVNGIDTSEIKNKNEKEKEKAYLARSCVLDYCNGKDVQIERHAPRKHIQEYLDKNVTVIWLKCHELDKYGRVIVDVYKDSNYSETLTEYLLKRDLGYEYYGGTKKEV